MPHVTLYALENELAGREPELISELTGAVVAVYGEWARDSVDVRLIGIPRGRWARGGKPLATTAATRFSSNWSGSRRRGRGSAGRSSATTGSARPADTMSARPTRL
jgi:phenylpyruvate tautomerase PptA (4-oxalocrotonate tautomerase family)